MILNYFASRLAVIAVLVLPFFAAETGIADDAQPIAIRAWPGGGFTIETMWDLTVGMGLSDETKTSLDIDIDLDANEMQAGMARKVSRAPNAKEVEIADGEIGLSDANAITVVRAPFAEGDSENAVAPNASIVFAGASLVINLSEVSGEQFQEAIESDSFKKSMTDLETQFANRPIVIATHKSHDAAFCEKVIGLLNPRMMIVNETVERIGDVDVESISHNTIAVSKSVPLSDKPRFVSLGTKPYEMPNELAALFEAKEAASAKSQAMFAKLSVAQMNFKPQNGSHTPRWNAEHMMGRELLFFSQIYHAVDPSIPVMDLNPKQMPKDYEFAHADWSGNEEALQMQRVQSFTRRFAYLLDGMELGARAKGSRWPSLRALLKQMDRHYGEHSANVVKKMKLENWPEE